ncbi:MAG: hypothetical protein AAF487_02195 [Bacteroidota bacterium]
MSFLIFQGLQAQEDEIYKAITIAPIDIFASDAEWSNDSIIKKVIRDTSFYQSFLNMKYFPHEIQGSLEVYFKDERSKAKMDRLAIQHLDNELKWVEIIEEKNNGKIRKKNGKYKYLTAEMYDEVFYPTFKHTVSPIIVQKKQEESKESKIEKYKSQLKKMLFNPGAPIESVPFIGDKLEIFSDEMVRYYEYSIFTSQLKDSTSCLVFKIEAKPEFRSNKTVIKSMTTYFDKESFLVLDRAYHLKYNHALFQFDIHMQIENSVQIGHLVPKRIHYSGWWDIPIKSAEIIDFELNCSNYILN